MIRITRLSTGVDGTFGALCLNGELICFTLEPPWRQNRRNVSSIPTGQYLAVAIESPRFGHTFEVTNVEGRSAIIFHQGNYPRDTDGCILVGGGVGLLGGKRAILNSGNTFNYLRSRLREVNQVLVTIVEAY